MTSELKHCQNCRQQFVIEPDDFGFYEKMGVPAPNLCPECRFKRRCLFRNEMTLYSRKCAKCNAPVISMYHPKLPYVIYCMTCWESDVWDPYAYAMDYDPRRPFFEQLDELLKKVPKKTTYTNPHTKLGPNIRSDYTNVAGGNKDCYMLFNGGGNENVSYTRGISFSRDTLDSYFGVKLERCYEVINTNNSSGVVFGHNVTASIDSWFVLNGAGLQNCFGCVNLRHKSYHFLNEPLQREAYEARVVEIRGSYAKLEAFKKEFESFSLKHPRRENNNLKAVRSTGDYIFESKNVRDSFEAHNCEDCRNLFSVKYCKDSYDVMGFGYESELLLETVGVGYSSRIIAAYWADNSLDAAYSFAVEGCTDILGCDGIKKGQYCILNKRYPKAEYERIRNQIIEELKRIGEYGLFMPPSLAPFAWNETIGQDNLPMTKEQALAQGFRWQDELQMTKGKETARPEQIPDHIKDVQDSILKEILACISCGRNYRIIEPELQFYRKMILPIPRKCFFCRHADRIQRRGPFKLFDRMCAKCGKAIKTNYAPERPELVYCEQCYQAEVI